MKDRLRFLSFNIHGGRGLDGRRDLSRINALIERLDIDIAVLQEVETRPSRGGSQSDLDMLVGSSRPHRLIGASMTEGDGWYGNVIASRYPIQRGLVHNLETVADLEPRNAVDALIETPHGLLRLIGTHLSLSMFERYSEARNLIRLIKSVEEEEKNPLFVMGDINEWQYPSALIHYMNSVMKQLKVGGTFPSFLPVLRLDRVWYDAPQLKAHAHRLRGSGVRHLSDHLPVVVEVDYSAH